MVSEKEGASKEVAGAQRAGGEGRREGATRGSSAAASKRTDAATAREQNLVSAAMSWAVSYVDAAAETRAEALWRKRLRWWRHADASTADKSFKRKYRMDQSAFNKLVGILRPVIERDETFARELSYVPLGIILKKCYIPVVKPAT